MSYKYENRLVAFIDILGFTGKISKSRNDVKSLNQLCEAIYSIQDFIKEAQNDFELPETSSVTQFSDSIVISLKMEDSYKVLSVFQLLKKIQINLLKQNILLRGGIVKGELIHTNELLLGPGLVNAYYLESKCAMHPRIVIDPKVLYLFARIHGKKKSLRIGDYDYHKTFVKDTDGTAYIDYFNDVGNYLNGIKPIEYFQMLCEILKQNIDTEDMSQRVKYLWMRERIKGSEYFMKYQSEYRKIVAKRNQVKKVK